MDAFPVDGIVDFGNGWQVDIFERPALVFFKAGAVDDVADVLFAFWGVGIDVGFDVVVGIGDDFDDAVGVCPLDEILAEARVFLAAAAEEGEPKIFVFAACPG